MLLQPLKHYDIAAVDPYTFDLSGGTSLLLNLTHNR